MKVVWFNSRLPLLDLYLVPQCVIGLAVNTYFFYLSEFENREAFIHVNKTGTQMN